jgi:hypothetical protein
MDKVDTPGWRSRVASGQPDRTCNVREKRAGAFVSKVPAVALFAEWD